MSNQLAADPDTIGLYGTLKGVGILAGGIGLAAIVKRGGRTSGAVATLTLVSAGGIVFSTLTTQAAILAIAPLWGVAVGFQWTNYVTITMGITDLRIAGSMFAIFQTMSNIGLGAGEGLATALSDNIGFQAVFRTFGLANILVVPLILFVLSRFRRAAVSDIEPVLAA